MPGKIPWTEERREAAVLFHFSLPGYVKSTYFACMVAWLLRCPKLVLTEYTFRSRSDSALDLPTPYNELVDVFLDMGFDVYLERVSRRRIWSDQKCLVIQRP